MFCSKCGNQLIEGALFCQKCGVKVCEEEKILFQPEILVTDGESNQKNDTGNTHGDIGNVMNDIFSNSADSEKTYTSAQSGINKDKQSEHYKDIRQEMLDGLKEIPFQKISDKMKKISLDHKEDVSTMHNGTEQAGYRLSDMPKSKLKKLIVTTVIIIAMIIIAVNWNGKNDYVNTVGEHTPFANSYGLPYTYEEVIEQYVSSPKWKVRKDGDAYYVDISGKLENRKIVITIKVSPDLNNPDIVRMSPESVTIDSEKSPTKDDALEFLFAMFYAYDNGYNNLSDLPW